MRNITMRAMPNLEDCRRRWIVPLLNGGIKDEKGQTLVELALTLPLLAALLLGAAEFGRLAYAAIEVANAARAGVAYGAQNSITASDLTGMQTAATNDGPDITGLKPTGLTAVATLTCRCSDGTAVTCTNAVANCLSPAHIVNTVQVNTTATMDPLFHVPGLPTTYTLKGSAIMTEAQ